MDRHRHVAEDRLRPGRGHRDRRVGVGLAGRRVDEVIAHRPQRPGLGRRHDLQVADAGPAARAPVDERLGPVRQPVPVQPLERDADGRGRALVHRVPQPAPVGRRPDAPLLGENHRPGRLGEHAHPLEIALTAQRLAGLALLRDDPVEHELGGDAGMVEPRQEQRPMAAHAGVADQEVLDRGPLGMPEVQRTRDVGRWLDDRERREVRVGRRAGSIGGEDVRGQPALVDRALDIGRSIGLRERGLVRVGHRACLLGPRENGATRSSSGRNGSWYHLLVRRAEGRGRAAGGPAPTRSRRARPATPRSSSRRRPRRRRSSSGAAGAGHRGSSPR